MPIALVTQTRKLPAGYVTLDSGCNPSIFKNHRFFDNLRRLCSPIKLGVAYSTSEGISNELAIGQGDYILPGEGG